MRQYQPKIAIIDPNTLAVLGLKAILQDIMPIMSVDGFGSFAELEANSPDSYYHYFVSMDILLKYRSFFDERRNKTIVLSPSLDSSRLFQFHCLCINVPERNLVKSLLALEQSAHAHGRNLPPASGPSGAGILSDREVEVMTYIVRGYINKEIAEKLNIGLATVVTHRKNIMEKLNIKSVSALTVYAVMHGYVDINNI